MVHITIDITAHSTVYDPTAFEPGTSKFRGTTGSKEPLGRGGKLVNGQQILNFEKTSPKVSELTFTAYLHVRYHSSNIC